MGLLARLLARGTSVFGLAKLLFVVVIIVYASSVAGSVSYQGEKASYLSVNNRVSLLDRGYSRISSTVSPAGISCGSPVTFSGTPGLAGTQLTSGDIIFDAQANTTATSTGSTCYLVTLYVSTSIANQTQYGPLYLMTGASPVAGQMIDCRFDIGTSLPPSPFTFKVTVQ